MNGETETVLAGPFGPMEKTYRLSPDGRAITCLRCGLTSHHPTDVAERYCGHCHGFHGQTIRPCEYPGCTVVIVLILGTRLPRFCATHDPP